MNRQIQLSFRFRKNKTCGFSVKKFKHYGGQFILTEGVNLGYREIKHLYKNRSFTPDCGYDNSVIIIVGDVYFPNTKCLGKLCLHKNTFHTLGRSNYQCPQCASVCQVRNIPFEDQTKFFFLVDWSWGLRF